jgi:nickel superoxide dismutase
MTFSVTSNIANGKEIMKKFWISIGIGIIIPLCSIGKVDAHCQMPCGIYHDEMVFEQIDQYIETMYKCMTILNESKFASVHDKNEFIRWVIQKEKSSAEASDIFLTYFLQQKIKPGEEDTPKKLASAHKLLFLIVQIKQNPDIKIVKEFSEEWEKFKLMFHVEGYEHQIEQQKIKKRELESEKAERSPHDHDHGHDHGHDHDHGIPHRHSREYEFGDIPPPSSK